MIKRIIFDIDNTLIQWDDKYYDTIDEIFKNLNIPFNQEIKINIIRAINDYENIYNIYHEKLMLDLFNKYTGLVLPNNFMEVWLKELESCIPDDNTEIKDILEYLSDKYEIVALTNWFTVEQQNRLKNLNLDIYFKEIIGTDLVLNKPNIEAFKKAIGKHKNNECVMIGDNLEKDIIGAENAGLNTILFDYKNRYGDYPYQKVISLMELKKYL